MTLTTTKRFATATLLATMGLGVGALTSPATARVDLASCVEPGNVITGTSGDDVLVGTPGRDIIRGKGGNDIIKGRGGNDSLSGGRGHDVLIGGRGSDCLDGGPGADAVNGDFDSRQIDIAVDVIKGGAGSDEGWYHEFTEWSSVERGKY